jgi:DNA-binding CsgD family transcriptional regulator
MEGDVRLFQRIWELFDKKPPTPEGSNFQLSPDMRQALRLMAEKNGRSEYDLTMDLVASGYAQQQLSWELMRCWKSLTPREREVVALICRDYSNRQIAEQLFVTVETVRTHVRRSLKKFGVRNRRELVLLLSGWQFSASDAGRNIAENRSKHSRVRRAK